MTGHPDDPQPPRAARAGAVQAPSVERQRRHPEAALVLIDLETDGGITGRSYVFGFSAWTLKPIVGCARRPCRK